MPRLNTVKSPKQRILSMNIQYTSLAKLAVFLQNAYLLGQMHCLHMAAISLL